MDFKDIIKVSNKEKLCTKICFLKILLKLIQSTRQNAIHMMDNPAHKLIKSLYMKLSRDMEDI